MENKAAEKRVSIEAETADRAKSLPKTQDGDTRSLPSPPSSVKAAELDSDRNADGSLSAEFAGSGSFVSANEGASTADAVNDAPLNESSTNDLEQEGTNLQDKPRPLKKVGDTIMIDSGDEDGNYPRSSLRSILNQIRTQTLFPGLAEEETPLRGRIKKGAKLAIQQMEYVRLMEDRMKDMEHRLRQIENKGVEDEPPAPPPGTANQPTDFIMDIHRMTFQEYLPKDPNAGIKLTDPFMNVEHKRRYEYPGQLPYHLIEVVVGDINQTERLERDHTTKPAAGRLDSAPPGHSVPDQDLMIKDSPSVQPERIRINSTLLLRALEKITGTAFSLAQFDDTHELQDQVILRPFKLFVTFEQEIRDEVDRLEKIHMPDGSKNDPEAPEITKDEAQSLPVPPITDTSIVPNSAGESDRENMNRRNDQGFANAKVYASGDGDNEQVPSLESRRCLEELLVLRDLLDKDLKPTFDLRKQIRDGSARSIAFQDLWHLFPLGSEIVSNGVSGQSQTSRVLNVSGGRPFLCNRYQADMDPTDPFSNGREIPKFDILTYYYEFNGKELGACQQLHTIKSYDGLKAITSLPYFPIIYSKNSRRLKPREFFIERGKRFLELARNTEIVHKRYNGLTLAMDELREEVDSEVIIDVGMALLKNNVTVVFGGTVEIDHDRRETLEFLDPRCSRKGCCQNTMIHRDYMMDETRHTKMLEDKGFMRDFIEPDSDFTEDDYLLCPSWVYGYVLRSRKWVKLDVSLVEDIKESGNGFDSLVLPEGHKDTLLALVKTHSQGKSLDVGLQAGSRQMDLVRGKGKGLIILLHGEPGVGKSSTAESVAEFTRRPLFQVTCGDIGESADEVERRLENHFQLAHKWGCVLLLDEADVFLEARSKTDLKRNAIVSVFLRVLEYYSGILFLTTNRVGAFDQAFRSRIHMSLFYPRIEEDATIKIWEMNIDRAREIWGDKLSIDEPDRKAILKFATKHYRDLAESETTWNGRQIRNAFQTAIALAEWDAYQVQVKFKAPTTLKPRLEAEHFERVAKASKHFDAYLKETQVGTMADLASERRERRDDFRGAEY